MDKKDPTDKTEKTVKKSCCEKLAILVFPKNVMDYFNNMEPEEARKEYTECINEGHRM